MWIFCSCFTTKKVVGKRDTRDQRGSHRLSEKESPRKQEEKDSQHKRKMSRRLEEALHRKRISK